MFFVSGLNTNKRKCLEKIKILQFFYIYIFIRLYINQINQSIQRKSGLIYLKFESFKTPSLTTDRDGCLNTPDRHNCKSMFIIYSSFVFDHIQFLRSCKMDRSWKRKAHWDIWDISTNESWIVFVYNTLHTRGLHVRIEYVYYADLSKTI